MVDVIDCTGSGDVDTSKVVSLSDQGTLPGAGGAALRPNPAWANPSGEWRVGCKRAFELFPSSLRSRMKEERRKARDAAQRAAVTAALRDLAAFDAAHPPGGKKLSDADAKRREELDARCQLLGDLAGDSTLEARLRASSMYTRWRVPMACGRSQPGRGGSSPLPDRGSLLHMPPPLVLVLRTSAR